MQTAGFGEIAPTACNTSEAERQINRRVEVWIEAANG
jgi:phosphate transport system substrate-binding protein